MASARWPRQRMRSEEHTSELQSRQYLVCRLLLEIKIAHVCSATYLLAQLLTSPIRIMKNSLQELANGRYDYRIAEERKDEFGELYAQFDRTADALEKRYEAPKPAATPSPDSGA